jgi:hypothetical protein
MLEKWKIEEINELRIEYLNFKVKKDQEKIEKLKGWIDVNKDNISNNTRKSIIDIMS